MSENIEAAHCATCDNPGYICRCDEDTLWFECLNHDCRRWDNESEIWTVFFRNAIELLNFAWNWPYFHLPEEDEVYTIHLSSNDFEFKKE